MPLLFVQCSIPNDARMQMKDRMPVSSTIVTEMPSTPRRYSILPPVPNVIHVCCSTIWKPGSAAFGGAVGWKFAVTTIEAIMAASEATVEIAFAALFGAIATSTAPTIGIQIVRDNRYAFIA